MGFQGLVEWFRTTTIVIALVLACTAGTALADPPLVCTEAGCVHLIDEDDDGEADGVQYSGGRDEGGVNVYVFREWSWVHGDVEAHGDEVPGEHPVGTFAFWVVYADADGHPALTEAHAEAHAWTLDHETGKYTHVTGLMAEAHDHDGDGRVDEAHWDLP